ncbi:retrovirus-related Pol polyprotein from transposon 17.6 [Trichonephila clavipes]|nr:retrovirus-related Pol polyprotein from transposon 17.6 [Trichonephila clavipes]
MWNYRVAGPRHRETILLAYGCFSDGGRMLSTSIGWRRQHSSIVFGSQKLNPSQQKWSTIEKEAYAIIWNLKRFEILLCGNFTSAAPQCPRLQRWALAIQRHDIEASHMKGSKLVNADALSRL